MVQGILQKSINLLNKRQTNILSAALVIMGTTVLSLILGLFKKRLLASYFGASNIVGVYDAATRLPDAIFQLTIASALATAFIPVFSEYLGKNKEKEGHKLASSLLSVGVIIFLLLSVILVVFAPNFIRIFNPGSGFSASDMDTMVNLLRIIVIAQFIFILGPFFSAILQSYNSFFISGFAASMYNLGIIAGLLLLSESEGIYACAYGSIIGAVLYILIQIPFILKTGYRYKFSFDLVSPQVKKVGLLMWPRVVSLGISQAASIVTISLISFLQDSGRNLFLFDLAQTLAFAPVGFIGGAIGQAALPVLSRDKDRLINFRYTFVSSFCQMLYLILPLAALILVLRIPIVRLVYGADAFDWEATVLTGRTLSYLSLFIVSSALLQLVNRAFYALQNTFIPLIVSGISTVFMVIIAGVFIMMNQSGLKSITYPYSFLNGLFSGQLIFGFGIEAIAFACSLGAFITLIILLFILSYKIGGFGMNEFYRPVAQIFFASLLTVIALYILLKLLDQLVFDTSRTVGLILLTGISTLIGLLLYLFLTWLIDVKEARPYLAIFRQMGNWREILGVSSETIEGTRVNQ